MAQHGATCTVAEFHNAVNVTFHDFESEVYDDEHRDMWQSLPQQIELLVGDCLPYWQDDSRKFDLLDIGSGTGLAADSVLRSKIGPRIRSVALLDSSPSMLRRAAERASGWAIPTEKHLGYLDSLSAGTHYDLIVTSSVLHHVPDLALFLRSVRSVQAAGGVFIHMQDPNGDFLNDPELRQRMAENSTRLFPEWVYRLSPARVAAAVYRRMKGQQGVSYIWKTNRTLIERGFVTSPLTVHELFAITDIHATHGDEKGICISEMRSWLPDYDCIGQRSYGFFGELWENLSQTRKKMEEQLIAAHALNGFHVGAAWKLR
jgi:SAM-dependent methyltransferase